MNQFKKISAGILIATIAIAGCKKETGPLSDIRPATPVTVNNAVAFRPEPTVSVSRAVVVSPGVVGPIDIILSIPASSPRTISAITRVVASTNYAQIQNTDTTGIYKSTPIAGSGKTVTFKTTLTEYTAKTGLAIPASNTELPRRFYFLLTLDDNSTVITEAVRVLVLD